MSCGQPFGESRRLLNNYSSVNRPRVNEKIYDLAILGGGATGLSFALAWLELAAKSQFISNKNIILLEARQHYQQDRHWSFWLPKDAIFPHRDVIKKSWSAWSFSKKADARKNYSKEDQQKIIHKTLTHVYCTIQAIDFYNKAQSLLQQQNNIRLRLDFPVQAVNKKDAENFYSIHSDNQETVHAKSILDSRNLSASQVQQQARYYQIFFGYEVEAKEEIFDAEVVGLMEQLQQTDQGAAFIYTLPFSSTQALVEYTLFTAKFCSPSTLEPLLNNYLQEKFAAPLTVRSHEQAVLPLGQLHRAFINSSNYLHVGSQAGALRESSGYGFLRLQSWAQAAVARYYHSGKLLPMPSESLWRLWLDRHFIKTLRLYPQQATEIFWQIAAQLPPDIYARFMRGEVSWQTLLPLLSACPKKPFFQALFQGVTS